MFEKKDERYTIKREANNYFERDEFAFILNQIIIKYIDNPQVLNIEKLAFITQYNPYYREPKYFNKTYCGIFDFLDLNQIDNDFIEDFRQMNFEYIFKDNIAEYIKKFIEKINNIPNFNTVIQLINIKNIENKNLYLDSLNKKYDNIISNEIGLLTDEKLKEAVHFVAKITIFNYIYEVKRKKFDFINKRIRKLGRIVPLNFIEIINLCLNKGDKYSKNEENENNSSDESENEIIEKEEKDIDYNEMKTFIFEEFSKKLNNENDIDNILNLIDCLECKNKFLDKLIERNLFTKDEFFSPNKNIKILLFYKLYEKGKLKKYEECYDKIAHLLDAILKDIEGNIKKSKLEEFLKNNPSFIKQRLSLIKFILKEFNPDEYYNVLKKRNDDINKDLNKLKYIKDNIILYFKDSYQNTITKIIDVIKNNQNKKLIDYKAGRIGDLIKETISLTELADKINEVKNSLIFNVIYDKMDSVKDENIKFENAYEILNEIRKYLHNNTNIIELNNSTKIFL